MKKSILAVFALTILAASTAQADVAASGTNFVSGNKNNDGKFTPRKVRAANHTERVPGFWDKEWKRSGLGESGVAKWNPLGDMKTFMKEKDDAYRAKHSAPDVK